MTKAFSTLIKRGSFAFLIKTSAAVFAIVFNILATRLLPIEEFGLYSLALTVGLVLVGITKFGLDNSLVKFLAISKLPNSKSSSNSYYSSVIIMVIAVTLFVNALVYSFDDFIINTIFNKRLLINVLPLSILLVLPTVLLTINSQAMRGLEHSYTSLVFSGLITSIFSIGLLLWLKPSTAKEVLEIVIYSAYFSCILSFFYCYLKLKLKLVFVKLPFNPIIKSCFPLWVVTLVGLLIQQLSVLLLGRWGSLSDISLFVIPLKITALMSFGLIALNTITAPKFAQYSKKEGKSELLKLISHSNKILLCFAIVSSVILLIFAEHILGVFGEHYIEGADLLRILTVGQFINVGSGSVVTILIMTGNEKLHQRNVLYIALLSAILMFILVPNYGGIGAAIATSISMAANNLVSLYFVKKLFNN